MNLLRFNSELRSIVLSCSIFSLVRIKKILQIVRERNEGMKDVDVLQCRLFEYTLIVDTIN